MPTRRRRLQRRPRARPPWPLPPTPPPARPLTLAQRLAAMGAVPALGVVPLPPTSPGARAGLSPTRSPAARDMKRAGDGVVSVTATVASVGGRAPPPPADLPRVGPDAELAAALARRRVD